MCICSDLMRDAARGMYASRPYTGEAQGKNLAGNYPTQAPAASTSDYGHSSKPCYRCHYHGRKERWHGLAILVLASIAPLVTLAITSLVWGWFLCVGEYA